MLRNGGFAVERRRVGKSGRDDGAVVHVGREPARRLLHLVGETGRTSIGTRVRGIIDISCGDEGIPVGRAARVRGCLPLPDRPVRARGARRRRPRRAVCACERSRGTRAVRRAAAPRATVGNFLEIDCPGMRRCPAATRTRSTSCRVKSSEMYSCAWKKRILRTRSVETRLAVRFATVPVENSMRAWAISTLSVITGNADGFQVDHRRVHQREQDIEIVDHHVVDHVNIQAARRENAQPVNFEKQRPRDDFLRGDRRPD